MNLIDSIMNSTFIITLSYYFILNLQWHNYRIKRVLFHHTKTIWHIIYFLLPAIFYIFLYEYNYIIVIIYLILMVDWYLKLDKKLVFTKKIKIFFTILLFIILFNFILIFIGKYYGLFQIWTPLIIAYVLTIFMDYILMEGYKNSANIKLENMNNLIIIGVTGSFGKTSIKNFLHHILSTKYKTYATPRSINTFTGIIKNINENLEKDTEIYIVEMGAREKGDILDITKFLEPQYSIVGKIGTAHIEYFKTLENIRNTKMEIIKSSRLIKAWVHISANVKINSKVCTFGKDTKNIISNLDKLSFNLYNEDFETKLLGSFNAQNLEVSIKVAKELGVDLEVIKKQISTIKYTTHRLEKIENGGKIILDDSFNGNLEGMKESFRISETYDKRKILITAGLIEVDEESNIEIAKLANEIFDLIVITSAVNYPIFQKHIDKDKFIYLKDKTKMETLLKEKTQKGDLILFSNDAPNWI